MMSSKNNSFTANDIQRYHDGTMSAGERHALEKAALDDPFLADALEGYAFSSSPSADLAKIQSRLAEKLNRKKVVPIFQKYRWFSAAAIVLIIAGAGWLVYSISKPENTSTAVAVQQKKDSSLNSGDVFAGPKVLRDSSASSSSREQPSANGSSQVSSDITRDNSEVLAKKSQRQLSEGKAVMERRKEYSSATIAQGVQNGAFSKNEATNNREVLNTEKAAVASNSAISPDSRLNNTMDRSLNQLPATNKNVTANPSASVKIRGISTTDSVKNINVVLQPLPADSSSLQEVVIGYGSRKKSPDKYPHVIVDTLEPAEGYVKFDDYVANNLKMPEELKTKPGSGEVQLSFDVDKDGQPVNIAVVKSLCEKCDEEAVRLLKEGPKWKKKKNKKGKITIKF